jgi:hypothetical protein
MDEVIHILIRENRHESTGEVADVLVDEFVKVCSEEVIARAEVGALEIHCAFHNV